MKTCPECGEANHVANYRCGCGYAFSSASVEQLQQASEGQLGPPLPQDERCTAAAPDGVPGTGEEDQDSVAGWFLSQGRILAAGVLFTLVLVLKRIGLAIGDTWDFTAFVAQLAWWPNVLGVAAFASTLPWLSLEDGYFSAVEMKKKLVHGAMLASMFPAMKLLDVLMGLGGFNEVSWAKIALWSLLAFLCAWLPRVEGA